MYSKYLKTFSRRLNPEAGGAESGLRSLLALRYVHLLQFFLLSLLVLALVRVALVVWQSPRLELPLLPALLLWGLRFDLLTLAYLLLPPLALSALMPTRAFPRLLRAYYALALGLLLAMEAIGAGFIAEYDHRPDALFWNYLRYPQEMWAMLFGGFKLEIAATLLAAAAGAAAAWRALRPAPATLHGRQWLASSAVALGLLALLFMAARGTLDHRPINISSAVFSSNRLANELALNSSYTTLYALRARKHSVDNQALYGHMPFAEALARIRASQSPTPPPSADVTLPTLHRVEPRQALARPRNVVILLEESLGARFVPCLGGQPLTPELCALAAQGVLFTRMYATGTRTVRGIEAVLTGFPPSASESVVKRSGARRGFFTLAEALKPAGYRNLFIYGGEANFDDMGSFMLGNGFDELIAGAAAYPQAQYRGSWGVADEDWARRAHQAFTDAQTQGPFFGLMLSTSNHTPWEYPPGRIKAEGPAASRENAVRYADYAIGEFFRLARSSSYWNDTVFLVVADHDARVGGPDFVPVDNFHIPAVLIAPGLAPRRYERLASQIDLLPTLLPLLGLPLQSVALGQDLFAQGLDAQGRALMQYGQNHGLLQGDSLVVHVPGQAAKYFRYQDGHAVPAQPDLELEKLALAYLTVGDGLYEQGLYRLSQRGVQ